MIHSQTLPAIISQVEDELSRFYDFTIHQNANLHLVSQPELSRLVPDSIINQGQRGTVWVEYLPDVEEIFIGIFIAPEIIEILSRRNPFEQLCNDNLDAFLVLVEEISHFHLIINRITAGKAVSRLELEWQGEVDKLLMAAILLKQQSGNSHYYHLARKLFEEAHFVDHNNDPEMYWEASRHAARFWYNILSYQDGIHDPQRSLPLQKILRQVYWESWAKKVSRVTNSEFGFLQQNKWA